MIELLALPTHAIWALVSALAVALLGVFTVSGGTSRPRGAFPFGLFAILWGFQIVFANLAPFARTPADAQLLYLLSLAFLLPLPYLLLEFSSSQQFQGAGGSRGWALIRGGAALAGIVPAIALFNNPALVLGTVRASGVYMVPEWGVLYTFLITPSVYVGLGLALVSLISSHHEAPTPRTRTRTTILLLGLGLYVSYLAGNNLLFYLLTAPPVLSPPTILHIVIFASLSATCVYGSWRIAHHQDQTKTEGEARLDTLAVAALVIPLVYGGMESLVMLKFLPNLYTEGVWRFVGIGLITYGLARWRIFELPRKARHAAAVSTGLLSAVMIGGATYTITRTLIPSSSFPLAMGAVGLAATAIPSIRYSRQLIAEDQGLDTPNRDEAIYRERIESYRAAVEASIARDTLEEDERFLRSLRERYDISREEDRVVRLYAENAVAVPQGEDVVGMYERLRLLGAGGAGRTWLARDRSRERLVVLKEPLHHWQKDPEIKENVLQEARLASRVRHPNVVLIEQVVEDDGGRPVLVMEYLEGGSLADVVSRRGKLPWRKAVDVMIGVLQGLEAIHEAGIVHRDVKPSNILLTSEGTPKIGDFGVAIPRSGGNTLPAGADEESTPGGPDAGTPRYMAPEVVRGSNATKRSDVYSAATVLQEVLTGEPPQHDTPTLLPRDVPDELARVLVRGLAREPTDRFESAGAFRRTLERVLEREPSTDPDPSEPEGSDGPIENFTSPDALSR